MGLCEPQHTSEDQNNSQELVLCFHHVGPDSGASPLRVVSAALMPGFLWMCWDLSVVLTLTQRPLYRPSTPPARGVVFCGFCCFRFIHGEAVVSEFTSGGQRTASKGPRFLSRGLYPLSHPCQPQVSGKVCGMMGSVFPVDPAGGILLQISQAWSSKAGQERI